MGLLDKMDATQFRVIDDGGETTFDQKMQLAHSIINKWPNLLLRFNKKVQYISEPFYQAWEAGNHKLANVIDADEIDESGVFVHKPSKSETNTVFYTIQTWGKGKDYKMDGTVLIFNNSTDKDKPALGLVSQIRPGMPPGGGRFYASRKAQEAGCTPISVIADILGLILFLKYCDLETKEIKAGKKDIHIGTKYVNETKNNIQILDSTWFTTIVRSEGFHVRGHFRWQPYPSKGEKQLIWIADYDKDGYTRKAKILNQSI